MVAVVFFNINLRFGKDIECDLHAIPIIYSYGLNCEIREFCIIGTADRAGTQFDIKPTAGYAGWDRR